MTIEISIFNGSEQRLLHINDLVSGAAGVIVVDSNVLGPG